MEKRQVAKIAVAAAIYPIDKPYSYLIPAPLAQEIAPGVRVTVPFGNGNRQSEGVVLSVGEEAGEARPLKAIERALDAAPVLTEEQLQLALFVRDRCFCTLFEAVRAMLPAGLWFKDGKRKVGDKVLKYVSLAIPAEDAALLAAQKRLKSPQQAALLRTLAEIGEAESQELLSFTGASSQSLTALVKHELVEVNLREVFRRPAREEVPPAAPIRLNPEQGEVYRGVRRLMEAGRPEAALLYGITGSGKTSVYIELARAATALGRTALVLVPEIALTPQFVRQFSSHFGDAVAVLHSSLTMGERYDEWKRIREGLVRVVIGTRSAVFAPLTELGLIIIDEEQEHTYKSENPPRYSAVDVAKRRCVSWNAVLLLGSATPSVDSMYYAQRGQYKLFSLQHRYNERPLPRVLLADMRAELRAGNGGVFSGKLREELQQNLEAGEQSILFLNRRGASGSILCGECGRTFPCPNCSVSLTYHSVGRKLLCHYCGHAEPMPERCPDCGGKLKPVGAGTQKAEEELMNLFPGREVIRMDADTVQRAGSHEKLLRRFREERVPFLLGTQMVTKGLDFENVTLVGVLSADQALYNPG
ncbi:MAG: replication restart helicase PriA, partial [bacterium]